MSHQHQQKNIYRVHANAAEASTTATAASLAAAQVLVQGGGAPVLEIALKAGCDCNR